MNDIIIDELTRRLDRRGKRLVEAHQAMAGFQLRFDGPPGPEGPRFIEAEDLHGKGIRLGKWQQDGEDWLLVVDPVGPYRPPEPDEAGPGPGEGE